MILEPLYKLQLELDNYIMRNLQLEKEFNSVEYVDMRILALKVEIAEFANKTGCFKYWKQSHVIDHDETLEELSDCIHLFLSLGNSRKYNFVKIINPEPWSKVPVKTLFRYLLDNPYDSSGKWLNGFEQLICIGLKLGYSIEEMEQAYKNKREINFKRQEESY